MCGGLYLVFVTCCACGLQPLMLRSCLCRLTRRRVAFHMRDGLDAVNRWWSVYTRFSCHLLAILEVSWNKPVGEGEYQAGCVYGLCRRMDDYDAIGRRSGFLPDDATSLAWRRRALALALTGRKGHQTANAADRGTHVARKVCVWRCRRLMDCR